MKVWVPFGHSLAVAVAKMNSSTRFPMFFKNTSQQQEENDLTKLHNISQEQAHMEPANDNQPGRIKTKNEIWADDFVIHMTKDSGNTELHMAVANGLVKEIVALSETGYDTNQKNASRHSPLHLAVIKNHPEAVTTLIDHDADPNLFGFSAHQFGVDTPLIMASFYGRIDVVQPLLDGGADPNVFSDDSNYTALHIATVEGQHEIMELLLEGGAIVDTRYSWPAKQTCEKCKGLHKQFSMTHITALHIACVAGDLTAVNMLLDHDADIAAKTGVESDADKLTTLTLAGKRQHVDVVETLLEKGACACQKNNRNLNPLQQMIMNDDPAGSENTIAIIQKLLKHGADPQDKTAKQHTLSGRQRNIGKQKYLHQN